MLDFRVIKLTLAVYFRKILIDRLMIIPLVENSKKTGLIMKDAESQSNDVTGKEFLIESMYIAVT